MNFETTYGLLEKCSVALKEIPLDWIFPTVALRRRRSFVVPSKEKILPSIDLQAKDHLFFFFAKALCRDHPFLSSSFQMYTQDFGPFIKVCNKYQNIMSTYI